jgi:predicted peptidase
MEAFVTLVRPVTLLFLLFAPLLFAAEDNVDGFIARIYRTASGETMPYRLFIPSNYSSEKHYPLVIWLHGAGGAGRDNIGQISEDQVNGTRIWTQSKNQSKYPSFVLVPQNPGNWVDNLDGLTPEMRLVIGILDSVKEQFNIDAARVYVAGQSDGGYGTWNLITQRPDLFAAAMPLCGGGDPRTASRIAQMPVWVFHGRRDDVIPVTESRKMIAAIQKAGGRPRYSEYARIGHDVWKRAFAEPELVSWLFAQHR